MKSSHHLSHDRASEGRGYIPDVTWRGGGLEGVRVGLRCSGVRPIGCHDKFHLFANQNVSAMRALRAYVSIVLWD